MTYPEAVDYLYKLQKVGAILGLDTARRLAALAGDPHQRLRFIHVAGTNGKGSTCAMLEAIYRRAGYKVGLFTSPHLISFAERIQVNRKLIPEADVARLVTEIRGHIEQIGAATLFEATTIVALRWFEEQKVDLVIWETGLGGRLDSTNIVTPLASVITNIQFDHEKWLGHSLREIAREKAGIIKSGVPVITGVEDESAWQEIQATAERLQAPCRRVTEWAGVETSLPGPHQSKNAAGALATVEVLRSNLPAGTDAEARESLQRVCWAGRFDVRGRYILDGAHNPAGAATLRATLAQEFPGERLPFIVGILADKDISKMAREFASAASHIYTVAVQSDRAADATFLAEQFRAAANTPVEACRSFDEALAKTESAPHVVITGSLHFIGDTMHRLGLATSRNDERGLNDWTGQR